MALDIQHPRATLDAATLWRGSKRAADKSHPLAFVSCRVGPSEDRHAPPWPNTPYHLFRDVSTATSRVTACPPVPCMQVSVLFSAQAPGCWPSTQGQNLCPRGPTSPHHLPPELTERRAWVEEQPSPQQSTGPGEGRVKALPTPTHLAWGPSKGLTSGRPWDHGAPQSSSGNSASPLMHLL